MRRFADGSFATETDGSTVTWRKGVVESCRAGFTRRATELVDGKACFERSDAPSAVCWQRPMPRPSTSPSVGPTHKAAHERCVLPLRRIDVP
ncbi:hypothetical protein E2F46_09060 [Luteimonas aestuarii]|uniref:Uncharacterized protein n=1 Tax=Luteimonas aestuarii TaxID=453837 RepID=A0A4R5TTT1_9GAMM|nr:hypothetical protein [Luteimonas aestuarii]TDK24418.1 hypothetical protein E2F46_09060 [Luteimonas aestuarii]